MVEYRTSAPAVTYAAPAPVAEYFAPAPTVSYAAPAPVIEHVAAVSVDEYSAPAPAVDTKPARVIEHVAPIPLDVYDASMMQVLGAVHQSVNQIPDVLVFDSMVEHSASSSSACAAPAPVDGWSMMSRSSSATQSESPRSPGRPCCRCAPRRRSGGQASCHNGEEGQAQTIRCGRSTSWQPLARGGRKNPGLLPPALPRIPRCNILRLRLSNNHRGDGLRPTCSRG